MIAKEVEELGGSFYLPLESILSSTVYRALLERAVIGTRKQTFSSNIIVTMNFKIIELSIFRLTRYGDLYLIVIVCCVLRLSL